MARTQCRNAGSMNVAWGGRARRSAQRMYELMFDGSSYPRARSLGNGHSPPEERKLYAALSNCAFVSTAPSADTNSISGPIRVPHGRVMREVSVLIPWRRGVLGSWLLLPGCRSCAICCSRLEKWVESLRRLLMRTFTPRCRSMSGSKVLKHQQPLTTVDPPSGLAHRRFGALVLVHQP